jgi:DNA-binding NarL/FixJ family response regulator
MKKLRILVADDHDVVRRGIRALLDGRADWEICGEAVTAQEAIEKSGSLVPDVVVLDVNMPGVPGAEVAREMRRRSPSSKIVVLTMDESASTMAAMFRQDVRGYVFKSDLDTDLLAAVESAAKQQRFFTSKVSQMMYQHITKGPIGGTKEARNSSGLTGRQQEVVRLLAEGKSNREVGMTLGISERTVEAHRAHIMARLGMKSFSELVRYALREGLTKG